MKWHLIYNFFMGLLPSLCNLYQKQIDSLSLKYFIQCSKQSIKFYLYHNTHGISEYNSSSVDYGVD